MSDYLEQEFMYGSPVSVVAAHCLGGPGKTLTFRAVEDKAFQLETTRGARTNMGA